MKSIFVWRKRIIIIYSYSGSALIGLLLSFSFALVLTGLDGGGWVLLSLNPLGDELDWGELWGAIISQLHGLLLDIVELWDV